MEMVPRKLYVCNIFGEPLDDGLSCSQNQSGNQCDQPPRSLRTLDEPNPPTTRGHVATDMPLHNDFVYEIKEEPPDIFPPQEQPFRGAQLDIHATVMFDDLQMKEEELRLEEDVKTEYVGSSDEIPSAEHEIWYATNDHVSPARKRSQRCRKPRFCRDCGGKCSTSEVFSLHLANHKHLPVSQEHACEKCGFRSKSKRGLALHMGKIHQRAVHLASKFCDGKFKTNKALSLHLQTHNSEKKYVCYMCKFTCSRRNTIKEHIDKLHTERKCNVCDYWTDRVMLMKRHMLLHENEKFICHICNFKCGRRRTLKLHIKSSHSVLQEHACEKCGFRSKSKRGLALHIGKIHNRAVPLACMFCDGKFKTNKALSLHLQTHNSEKKYVCYVCKFTCSRRKTIKEHIDKLHTERKCNVCDYWTDRVMLMKRHMLLHENEKFICHVCNFKCGRRRALKWHIQSRHSGKEYLARLSHLPQRRNTEKASAPGRKKIEKNPSSGVVRGYAYECHYCNFHHNNRIRLKCHIFKEHLKEHPYVCYICEERFKRRDRLIGHIHYHKGEKPFACSSCSYKTHLKVRLSSHLRRKHPTENTCYECDRCEYKTIVKDYFMRHRNTTHRYDSTCDVCGYIITSEFTLKRHMTLHSFVDFHPNDEKPFHCASCASKFSSMKLFSKHNAIYHKGEANLPQPCQICGKQFPRKQSLNVHMLIHSGEKPHACQVCDFRCRNGTSLTKHMRSHLGLKPYACKLCNYKARSNGDVKRHMTIHTGERNYACEFCDYRAARRTTYNRHVMTHTGNKPHACKICSYKAAASSDLKRHVMTHTGDKLFSCDSCSFRTMARKTLERHIVIHKGMKKFICSSCNQICYTRKGIKNHLKAHAGGKEYVCFICHYKCNLRREMKFHFECTKEGSHWPVLSMNRLLRKCKN